MRCSQAENRPWNALYLQRPSSSLLDDLSGVALIHAADNKNTYTVIAKDKDDGLRLALQEMSVHGVVSWLKGSGHLTKKIAEDIHQPVEKNANLDATSTVDDALPPATLSVGERSRQLNNESV